MSSDDTGDVDTAALPEQVEELRVRAVRGVGWLSGSMAIAILLALVRMPILMRLLDPADYGRMAWVSVFTGLALPICSLGVWSSIIRERSMSRSTESSLFWLNMGLGAAFCCVFVGVWGCLHLLGLSGPSMQLLAFCSLTLVLDSGSGFLRARHNRKLRFHVLFWADTLAALVSTVAAIICAKAGMGAWSLAIGLVTCTLVNFIVCGPFSGGIPAIGFCWQEARKHVIFGRAIMVTSTVNIAATRLHYMFARPFMGETGLGLLSRANTWMGLVSTRMAPNTRNVAFSAISRLDTTEQDAAGKYLTVTKGFLLMAIPFFLTSAIGAKFLVPLVFSEKWLQIVPLLQVLAVSALIRTVISLQSAAFLTLGYPSYRLIFEIVCAVSNALLVGAGAAIGYKWGGPTYAYCGSAIGFSAARLVQLPVFTWLLKRCGGYGMGMLLKTLMPVLISGAVAGVAGIGCLYLLPPPEGPLYLFLALSLVALVVSATFLGAMAIMDIECLRNWGRLGLAAVPIHRLAGFGRKGAAGGNRRTDDSGEGG